VAGFFSKILGGQKTPQAPEKPIRHESEEELPKQMTAEHGFSRDVADMESENFDFDEEWYLREYPDVADAVREGRGPSGRSHYISHGRYEGRRPVPPEQANGGTDGADG
jgi:hypothetical protein